MNTLAYRYNQGISYPIPHADYLRLSHAHRVGVMFLDMLEAQQAGMTAMKPGALPVEDMASLFALLTDQIGHVVTHCETHLFNPLERAQ
ncbi:hypothetical protein CS369_08050 [Candidatus Symbiopectobacterium sp. 'North America']|uniref:hypothetical protein n=1 Tax=Candidatus Symbiopectobacterium sp. 'North America' TaxID=2794574 RepID=UPI0018C9E3C7|nr:hypothetical protein [Candidatus Symbiopectobacterium sp. 'North America']MBG6244732.1 hypothetical protein [Candidatus Symbiopectobacterium sp. 'North America']